MAWLLRELRLFFIALQFFTRIPIPAWVGFEPVWLQQCARYFPLVGLCVGAVSAAVLWGAQWLWPAPVAVGLAMAASMLLTGGFHEDGLADTCDGLGGAVSREKALLIMKDSRLGSYGALGLIMVLGLKAACLIGLAEAQPNEAAALLLWVHGASRVAPLWLMHALPYGGDAEHAKAKPLATSISNAGFAVGLLWVLLAAGALVAWRPALLPLLCGASVAAAAMCLWMQAWLDRRLGGYTGDNLGASQQLSELAALLALLALWHLL
ncbi:adenosylcobinamide-GDP ribazoletransferase [Paucibacter sp. APW11]|uniref:Adenosylcobinamide-GDP ribazoletransferase n=1 Tax=Roseateles aquae TaxID=3077235 RepID=A0ABU3PCZ4_9BURK|nr:adenosylcobinamide-GDP ribazoletransferase [Paucibacter sp. APW11]MDT9000185.1 adenosylcobinamide-GDP ribazoletransferase [Paucibacter sp. APW11]